ncbi:MAG: FAD binding domain-containing protein, partial [Phycisphaerae bacterium]|nr:FAD binding domain-containing protein [Phycisphaerae bacterium]
GNIVNASPAADGVLALMASDARVVLRWKGGESEVALDEFYTGYKQMKRQPDQLITMIRVPRRRRKREWLHKVGARCAQAITKVGVAVVQDECGWRVVANSVAPFVCRCRNMEKAIACGVKFATPGDVARVLAGDVSPIDDIRSTARYRVTVLSRLLYFWLAEQM